MEPPQVAKVIAATLLIYHCLSGVEGVNILETSPPAVDGFLTSCGETMLMCSHDNVDGENTRWRIATTDSPDVCVEIISHASPTPTNPYMCDEFGFVDITGLSPRPAQLNSTAVVNPLPLMLSGNMMSCSAGGASTSPLVGMVTFCVVDQTSSPTNLRSVLISSNVTSIVLEWDPLSTCSRDPVSYTLTIDGSPVPTERITVESDTRYIVSGLQPNQRYMAAVSAVVSNCMTASGNLEFEITARTPRPMVTYEKFCANSSDFTTIKISWTFPSSAPNGVVYPPTDELTVEVRVDDGSGQLVVNTTMTDLQTVIFDVDNDEMYSVVVTANHSTTGPNSSNPLTLSSQLCTVNTTTTSVDNSVIVRLSTSCTEESSTFSSNLTYGTCSSGQNMSAVEMFNSSGATSFSLNAIDLVGRVCLEAVATHPNGLSRSCVGTNGMVMQQLTFNQCSVDLIRSAAGTGVTVTFTAPVSSGEAPHGTVATFGTTSDSLVLDGPSQSFCQNGTWNDLTPRTTTSSGGLPPWAIAVIIIFIIIIIIVGAGISGYLTWRYPCWKKKSRRDDSTELDVHKDEPATYADPNSIDHHQAPGGEEYAVVDKSGKKQPEVSGALYQDPSTIKHEEAVSGDVYTVVEKKPKKGSKKTKEQTETELAQMYSVPDKSRKNQGGLTYAEIDLPSGGNVPAHHPTEYATVVD